MSSTQRRKMHINSLAAFYSGRVEVFSQREQQILRAIAAAGRATDREICMTLGFTDLNAVRPRITELIHDGLLEECGTQTCHITGKQVRVTRICPGNQGEQFDLFQKGAA